MRGWRRLLALLTIIALAAGVMGVMVACGEDEGDGGDGAAEVSGTVSFCSYGGTYQEAQVEAWIDPFKAANPNITIVEDEPTDYAKIQAMVESGNVTWDVVQIGNDFALGEFEKFCEPLDPEVVPMDELQPDVFPTNGYRAPVITYSTVIGYRPDKLNGNVPTSFADFFDLQKFPGKRGVYNYASGGLLEMALVADGVAPDDLYPLDLERAFKKMDTIKDQMVWWDTGAQSAQLLADGEVSMGMSWNGRLTEAAEEGAPIEIMWDQHILAADYLMIPKGSKNIDAAMQLIAWMVSADHNAEISKFIDYGPTNINAVDKVDPVVAARIPTAYAANTIPWDDFWWAENYNTVAPDWQNWVTK